MKRLLIILAIFSGPIFAQSCAVTAPSTLTYVPNAAPQTYSVSLTSVTNADHVQYLTDAYPDYRPGISAYSVLGTATLLTGGSSFTLPVNSTWYGNGPRLITANVYDALGNLLVSCQTTATTANVMQTQTINAGVSITPCSSYTGACTMSVTLTGTGSDSISYNLFIDGVAQYSFGPSSSGTKSLTLYTQQFSNGTHVVGLSCIDNTTMPTFLNGVGVVCEWSRQVTFSNGTTASQLLLSSHEVYLAAGGGAGTNCANATPTSGWGSCAITAQILNTDGTLSAVSSPLFTTALGYVQNPGTGAGSNQLGVIPASGVATINQSTGVITASGNGPALLSVMAPTISMTDLTVGVSVVSASELKPYMNGWIVQVTGGTGCTTGIYQISGTIGSAGTSFTMAPSVPGAQGVTCTAVTGPTRQLWVYVWPTNSYPSIGSDGSTNTTYNAAKSMFVTSAFNSPGINVLNNEQPYNSAAISGCPAAWTLSLPCGAANDLHLAHVNTYETAPIGVGIVGTESAATFQAYANAYLTGNSNPFTNAINLYPEFRAGLYFGSLASGPQNLGAWSYGTEAATNYIGSQTGMEWLISQWIATGKTLGVVDYSDESFAGFGFSPLGGPYTMSASGTAQSPLESISCNGTTCTATLSGAAYMGFTGNDKMVITGSGGTGDPGGALNSATGTTYSVTLDNPGIASALHTFSFPSTFSGTVNASNDPGLTVEPYADGWYYNSNTNFAHYDIWAKFIQQYNAVASNNFILGGSNGPVPYYAGLTGQSISGVTSIVNIANEYYSYSLSQYLISRESANGLLALNNQGFSLRSYYGVGYNPSIPQIQLTNATGAYYGYQGYNVNVTSCSGNVCQLAASSGLSNIIPGSTKLYITGATNSTATDNANNNYLVLAVNPSANTVTLALGATNFSCSACSGETITFQDGSTNTVTTLNAQGTPTYAFSNPTPTPFGYLPGDTYVPASFTASDGKILYRKRGQTFTMAGGTNTSTPTATCLISGNCSPTAATFELAPWNLNLASAPSGNPNLHYVEIPRLNSTGGTATILPDFLIHHGVSYIQYLSEIDPGWAFGQVIECLLTRCSGQRVYKIKPWVQGYSDQIGFTGTDAQSRMADYADTSLGQSGSSVYGENGYTKPVSWSMAQATIIADGLKQYLLTPPFNSPDCTFYIDTGARGGAAGNIFFALNATDGTQSCTVSTTPYLQSGQQFYSFIADGFSTSPITLYSAGTSSVSFTLGAKQAIFIVFPVTFAGSINEPSMTVCLADVSGATQVAVKYGYEDYFFDAAAPVYSLTTTGSSSSCAHTLSGTIPMDLNMGTAGVHPVRIMYLDSGNHVVARGDIQRF